ncbi:MAG: sugar-binding domain-containing protein, partial [Maritimibacter sp.]
MPKNTKPNRTKGDKDSLLANIALLYYGEGLTQSEIAARMKVSRATIVNMLRDSREKGIVEIRVDGKNLSSSSLARELRQKFDLKDVYVATSGNGRKTSRAVLLEHVARVGATAVLDIVEPGDRIGVAWGETILALSNVMARTEIDNVEVCQLIGSMKSERVPASENCTIQIANKLGATCFTLHAPGLVATAEMAQVFRAEPTIKTQLERLEHLDMTIASIGNTAEETHLAAADMVTAAELKAARSAGAVGVLCCRFIDARGEACRTAPDDRLVTAEVASLKRVPKKLLVVCGIDRAEATLAALNGGLVT